MFADILSDIQGSGMFSLVSLFVIAIGTFALLLMIPVISSATSLKLGRRTDSSAQIKLLKDELQVSHQKRLELEQKIQRLISEKAALHQEGVRLHEELQQQRLELSEEFRTSTFEQLQTLLTNYPSIHQMVNIKPELPVKNLLSMFTPLDNVLAKWGYEQIGKPWEQVPYNSQLHQPDNADITEGELVYIRFVGYQHQGRILCPAKVSRTLPGGGK
ncbi:molecular chaperone GrpE [Nostoc sp. FACHB-152]|uniref:nucleotide exchange factor GrpE n=1 Tax=unclassified Nostoc TaxID=2593658 RepID=UPI001683F9B4|nr:MULTISPECIES: molecular chaperone GrpE [unclassified Nostoc]MBD2452009.1 molecular chaperone GrpE [Nostoc sp. FACHB-152]MBD2472997.1 molecular chaperone GrpE [Nostoc sp. FACHB-145]